MIDFEVSCNLICKATWENLQNIPSLGPLSWKSRFACLRMAAINRYRFMELLHLILFHWIRLKNVAEIEEIQRDTIMLLVKQWPVESRISVELVDHCPESRASIVSRYKDLFTGVGLLKGYGVHLHIDNTIESVAQPVRRTQFRLRDNVDEKLDELLACNIIEPVANGLTRWDPPLVVALKQVGVITKLLSECATQCPQLKTCYMT